MPAGKLHEKVKVKLLIDTWEHKKGWVFFSYEAYFVYNSFTLKHIHNCILRNGLSPVRGSWSLIPAPQEQGVWCIHTILS